MTATKYSVIVTDKAQKTVIGHKNVRNQAFTWLRNRRLQWDPIEYADHLEILFKFNGGELLFRTSDGSEFRAREKDWRDS